MRGKRRSRREQANKQAMAAIRTKSRTCLCVHVAFTSLCSSCAMHTHKKKCWSAQCRAAYVLRTLTQSQPSVCMDGIECAASIQMHRNQLNSKEKFSPTPPPPPFRFNGIHRVPGKFIYFRISSHVNGALVVKIMSKWSFRWISLTQTDSHAPRTHQHNTGKERKYFVLWFLLSFVGSLYLRRAYYDFCSFWSSIVPNRFSAVAAHKFKNQTKWKQFSVWAVAAHM